MVKKYFHCWDINGSEMVENPDGDFVRSEDYDALEAEVERLKEELAQYYGKMSEVKKILDKKDADLAALVTALDEYHQAYTNHSEFISENGFDSLGFVVCEITPASRATAEKWLKKEE